MSQESRIIDEAIVDGARRLTSEIIRKAIDDYKLLEKRGYVRAGVVNKCVPPIRFAAKRRRVVCGFMSVYDVFNLIDFFWSDELATMCKLTQLEITPETVRATLGLPKEKPVFEGLEEIRNARSRRGKSNW